MPGNPPARLDRVTFTVNDDRDIMATRHWSDGTRDLQWFGPWSAIKAMWSYMRQGVKVDSE